MTTIYLVDSIGAPRYTPGDGTIAATGGTKTTRMPGICLAAVVLVATLAAPARAVDKSWNAGTGSWSNAVNWTPAGVPGNADVAHIGNLPGVQSDTVYLDQDETVAGLVLTDAMGLQTEGHRFIANGDTILDGPDTRLNIFDTAFSTDYFTENLHVSGANAHVNLEDAALLIGNQFTLGEGATLGRLFDGVSLIAFEAASGTTFSNGGQISAGPGHTNIFQLSDGLYDLDGPQGNGEIQISGTSEASMTIVGHGLTDAFSGTLSFGPHSTLSMSIFDGWEADFSSNINVFDAGFETVSVLAGNPVRLAGNIDVTNTADFRVTADATLASTAFVEIGDNASLEFGASVSAVIEGGSFFVGENSQLAFSGDTKVEDGYFSTVSNLASDGRILFGGPTEWDAAIVVIDGFAVQNWIATVTGPTVIDADVFDMDGDGGGTTWDVSHSLVVNAAHVDAIQLGDKFDGTIDVGAGAFAPHLTINLDDPGNSWTMAGDMNLGGVQLGSSYVNRLAGSPVQITGELNVDHRVRVTADTTFDEGSVVSFAGGSAAMQTTGRTIVRAGAIFVGTGLLDNGATGQLTLADDVSLDQVGLTNRGLLEIGDSPGIASVDRFTNLSSGMWRVEIGGYVLGDEFDHLQVTGGVATLDGLLDVDLISPPGLIIGPGSGPFMPEIGDTFTILTALGGVEGQFIDGNPVSKAGGKFFHWSVLYHPFDVTLQLTSVSVPEPASAMLMIAAAMTLPAVRRTRVVAQTGFPR